MRDRAEQRLLGLLVLADLGAAAVTYAVAFALRVSVPLPFTTEVLPVERIWRLHHAVLPILSSQVVLLYFFGLYDLRRLGRPLRIVADAMGALGIQVLTVTAWYFFRNDLFFPRSVLVLFWVLNSAAVAALRLAVRGRVRRERPRRVLLVGTDEDVQGFLQRVSEVRRHWPIDVAGVIALNGKGADGYPLASGDELGLRLTRGDIDDVILLSPPSWKDELLGRLQQRRPRPRVAVIPSVYDILVGRVSMLRLHDVPLLEVVKDPRDDLAFAAKRVVDIVLAGGLLALSLPILGLAAAMIKLTSSGPVLYRQRRVGEGGREFVLYKLRTMAEDAEVLGGPQLASSGDGRVTRVGRWLRMTRIDEIPQLINVLNGTMSMVGPRPERPEFVTCYRSEIPGYMERFQIKPGVTGLAQVSGEYNTTPSYKLKYDLAYLYNYSLFLDLRILLETVKVMVTRRGI